MRSDGSVPRLHGAQRCGGWSIAPVKSSAGTRRTACTEVIETGFGGARYVLCERPSLPPESAGNLLRKRYAALAPAVRDTSVPAVV